MFTEFVYEVESLEEGSEEEAVESTTKRVIEG